jgi:hypothetical protein
MRVSISKNSNSQNQENRSPKPVKQEDKLKNRPNQSSISRSSKPKTFRIEPKLKEEQEET